MFCQEQQHTYFKVTQKNLDGTKCQQHTLLFSAATITYSHQSVHTAFVSQEYHSQFGA